MSRCTMPVGRAGRRVSAVTSLAMLTSQTRPSLVDWRWCWKEYLLPVTVSHLLGFSSSDIPVLPCLDLTLKSIYKANWTKVLRDKDRGQIIGLFFSSCIPLWPFWEKGCILKFSQFFEVRQNEIQEGEADSWSLVKRKKQIALVGKNSLSPKIIL